MKLLPRISLNLLGRYHTKKQTRVNEFKQKVFYLTEAKESHFFVLYWLINERSTDNATEIEKVKTDVLFSAITF